jgi:hypothetical protein
MGWKPPLPTHTKHQWVTPALGNPDRPPDTTIHYVSLPRTAGILDEPVAAISHLRNNPAFPRRYNFDTDSINGCPAIKREPHFRLDEIQQWKQRAGEVGNCDPPPGERKTAVRAARPRL